MSQWKKNKDGKFAGSVGHGKTAVPTPGSTGPTPVDDAAAVREWEDYRDYLDNAAQAWRKSLEPSPTHTETHLVTDPGAPVATVTHTTWSDGQHTVDITWTDTDGQHTETVLSTDDTPDIAHAVRTWQGQQ